MWKGRPGRVSQIVAVRVSLATPAFLPQDTLGFEGGHLIVNAQMKRVAAEYRLNQLPFCEP
jgi:hypothetical protein